MMCFVEYRSAGFWCRNETLREWIAEMVAAAKRYPNAPAWLPTACAYWEALRSSARYTRTDVRFDVNISTPQQQHECLQFLEAVGQRKLDDSLERVNAQATALLRGDLAGTDPLILD